MGLGWLGGNGEEGGEWENNDKKKKKMRRGMGGREKGGVPGYCGRKGVATQRVADCARGGFEVGCEQGVGAEGARRDLCGEAPDGALEGGAAGIGVEGWWEGGFYKGGCSCRCHFCSCGGGGFGDFSGGSGHGCHFSVRIQ